MQEQNSTGSNQSGLFRDIDWKVRCRAASLLGKISEKWALQTLSTGLQDPDPDVRAAVITALGNSGNSGAAREIVLSRAVSSAFSSVRAAAAQAFGKLKDPACQEYLLMLAEDSAWEVRDAAIAAIELHTASTEPDNYDMPGLMGMLKSSNPIISDMAHKLIVNSGDRAVEFCSTALQSPAVEVRRKITSCLSGIGTAKAVEAALPALKDKDATVRRNAVKTVSRMASSEALEVIAELLADRNERVRTVAAETLVAAGTEVLPLVRKLVNNPDSPGRRELVRVLGKSGGEDLSGLLINFLGDPSFIVRREAISIISGIREFPVDQLIEIVDKGSALSADLSTDHNTVWKIAGAISVLGNIECREAIGPIVRSLNIPDSRIQAEAVTALGHFKRNKVHTVLTRILKRRDMSAQVKENALRALAAYSSEKRLPATELFKSDNARIRLEAVRVLEIAPPRKALKPLKALLDDPCFSIRREAGFALHNAGDCE